MIGSSRTSPSYLPAWVCLNQIQGRPVVELAQTQRAGREEELRKKAALARKAASTPTSGSGGVDRLLVLLAAQLERDARVLEQE